MRLSLRQSWQLRDIERRLRRSEPHMAAMLMIFTMLTAEEAISSREHVRQPRNWRRPLLEVLAAVIAGLAAAARWVSRQAARLCVAARRRLSRSAPTPLGTPSAAENASAHRRSLG